MKIATLLEDRPNGWYYTGPLHEGIEEATASRHVLEGQAEQDGISFYRVLLGDGPDVEQTLAEFGSGPDQETAWRYALGAYYGPLEGGQ